MLQSPSANAMIFVAAVFFINKENRFKRTTLIKSGFVILAKTASANKISWQLLCLERVIQNSNFLWIWRHILNAVQKGFFISWQFLVLCALSGCSWLKVVLLS